MLVPGPSLLLSSTIMAACHHPPHPQVWLSGPTDAVNFRPLVAHSNYNGNIYFALAGKVVLSHMVQDTYFGPMSAERLPSWSFWLLEQLLSAEAPPRRPWMLDPMLRVSPACLGWICGMPLVVFCSVFPNPVCPAPLWNSRVLSAHDPLLITASACWPWRACQMFFAHSPSTSRLGVFQCCRDIVSPSHFSRAAAAGCAGKACPCTALVSTGSPAYLACPSSLRHIC